MKPIEQYIKDHDGNSKSTFARAVGATPQDVSRWIARGFYVTSDGWIINPKVTKRNPRHSI